MLEKYYSTLSENPKDVKVDLHMHSIVSDGTWPPEILVKNVKDAGIKIFALTDHDDVAHVEQTGALAIENDMFFIPGVEINSTFKDHSYHILGLGVDILNEALLAVLEENRNLFIDKDDGAIRYLQTRYPQVSPEEFKAYHNKRERGGWKALNYLIDKKLCANFREYFKLFEGEGSSFLSLTFHSPAEVITLVHNAGGQAILAHPGASFYDPDYQFVLDSMLSEGIDGVECFHPENNEAVTQYALDFCRSHGLLITGGSDCHGTFLPARCYGRPDVRLSDMVL